MVTREPVRLNSLIPMLNVSDIEASLAFYREALGFEVVSAPKSVSEWRWATIRSGDAELMLSESDCDIGLVKGIDPHHDTRWPTIFYFYPDDVEALHAHVRDAGFACTEPETTFYGMREFSMQDPDGHLLTFGQDAGTQVDP